MSLGLCGLTLRLESEDRQLLAGAARRYAPFRVREGRDVQVLLEPSARKFGRMRDEPRVERAGRGVRVSRHDFEMEWTPGRARARIRPEALSLDSLLRILMSLELFRRGGFLCHAAAVDGWLLPGRSGAGKSTFGDAAPRRRLLADELVGVVGDRLHSTPFWGEFQAGRNNGSRRLEAIFLLDRRAPRGVRPVSKTEAMGRILGCALFFLDDESSGRGLLRLVRRTVESAPCFVLSYDAKRTTFKQLETRIKNQESRIKSQESRSKKQGIDERHPV